MAVKKIVIPEIGSVSLYKRRGVKGLRLSITSRGEVRVSLPHWLPYTAGTEFAKKKRDWILSHKPNKSSQTLKPGGRIGKAHRVLFLPDHTRSTVASRISGGEIRIHHPAHLEHLAPEVQKIARSASIRALKSQAGKLLPQRLDTLATQHDFTYSSVHIKQLTSRWGSCSSEGVISLSCFLMQLPWHLIDYVLLHELLHTRIMAHGPVFWRELEQYVPNVKTTRKEIKDHRPVLLASD